MNTVLLELHNFLFQLQAAMVILVVCHVGVLSRVVEVSLSLGPYIKFDCNLLFLPAAGTEATDGMTTENVSTSVLQ